MDFTLWEVAVAVLLGGISYGVLVGAVRSVSNKVTALEKSTEEEFHQVWNEMRQASEQRSATSEAILIRLAKIELTLERVAKWADRQQG